MIDGCGTFGFFWRVLLPLARPALATVSVLAIVGDLERIPVAPDPAERRDQWTLPLGVMNFSTEYSVRPGPRPGVHGRGAHAGGDVLRLRRAAARRRPDCGSGERLMAMTEAPYRDAGLPIDARVEDLLARMTIEEKAAQLGSIWSFEVVREGALDLDRSRALLGAGIGQVTRIAGGTNLDAFAASRPRATRSSGSWSRRRGWGSRRSSTRRPSTACSPATRPRSSSPSARPRPRGTPTSSSRWRPRFADGCWRSGPGRRWARSWTSPATRAGAGSRRRTARTRTWPPSSGCAYVRGLQGRDVAEGVLATGKHMVGHGLAEGGLNQAPVHVGHARAARRAAAAVRSRGPGRRPGEHDAGLLRRRRCAVPRLAGAPDRRSSATSGGSTASSSPTTPRSRCSRPSTG